MKRTLLACLCAAVVLLMIAGCGGGTLEYAGQELPGIVSITPADGSVGVEPDVVVTVVFSGPVPPELVDLLTIRVTNALGEVAGTVAYDAVTYTATFTPTYQFTLTGLHTISISAAKTKLEDEDLTSSFLVRDGSWEGSFRLSSESSFGGYPSIAFNGMGNALAVWLSVDDEDKLILYASCYEFGGSWSEPQLVFENSDNLEIEIPEVLLDPSGKGLVVFKAISEDNNYVYAIVN